MSEGRSPLYIFIDESGNFDFSPSGTKYFILTAVSTFQPLVNRSGLINKLYEKKYNSWSIGHSDYYFHATEDLQMTRDFVFSVIKDLDDIEIDSVVVQKNKTMEHLYNDVKISADGTIKGFMKADEQFYDKILQILLKYIFTRNSKLDPEIPIVIVLGRLFTDNKREYILKSIKKFLKNKFPNQFYIYFYPTEKDINAQVADYCGWAVYIKFERGEERAWSLIKSKVKSCFDVFKSGKKEYYQYKK